MEKIESMANIDKIVFAIQNNTNAGFFFIPWVREGIIYLHSYHPSYSGYEHCGKLTEAMNKVFD